ARSFFWRPPGSRVSPGRPASRAQSTAFYWDSARAPVSAARRGEDQRVSRVLQPRVQRLILRNVSDEVEGAAHKIVLVEVDSEARQIHLPAEISDSQIEILPVDETEVPSARRRH